MQIIKKIAILVILLPWFFLLANDHATTPASGRAVNLPTKMSNEDLRSIARTSSLIMDLNFQNKDYGKSILGTLYLNSEWREYMGKLPLDQQRARLEAIRNLTNKKLGGPVDESTLQKAIELGGKYVEKASSLSAEPRIKMAGSISGLIGELAKDYPDITKLLGVDDNKLNTYTKDQAARVTSQVKDASSVFNYPSMLMGVVLDAKKGDPFAKELLKYLGSNYLRSGRFPQDLTASELDALEKAHNLEGKHPWSDRKTSDKQLEKNIQEYIEKANRKLLSDLLLYISNVQSSNRPLKDYKPEELNARSPNGLKTRFVTQLMQMAADIKNFNLLITPLVGLVSPEVAVRVNQLAELGQNIATRSASAVGMFGPYLGTALGFASAFATFLSEAMSGPDATQVKLDQIINSLNAIQYQIQALGKEVADIAAMLDHNQRLYAEVLINEMHTKVKDLTLELRGAQGNLRSDIKNIKEGIHSLHFQTELILNTLAKKELEENNKHRKKILAKADNDFEEILNWMDKPNSPSEDSTKRYKQALGNLYECLQNSTLESVTFAEFEIPLTGGGERTHTSPKKLLPKEHSAFFQALLRLAGNGEREGNDIWYRPLQDFFSGIGVSADSSAYLNSEVWSKCAEKYVTLSKTKNRYLLKEFQEFERTRIVKDQPPLVRVYLQGTAIKKVEDQLKRDPQILHALLKEYRALVGAHTGDELEGNTLSLAGLGREAVEKTSAKITGLNLWHGAIQTPKNGPFENYDLLQPEAIPCVPESAIVANMPVSPKIFNQLYMRLPDVWKNIYNLKTLASEYGEEARSSLPHIRICYEAEWAPISKKDFDDWVNKIKKEYDEPLEVHYDPNGQSYVIGQNKQKIERRMVSGLRVRFKMGTKEVNFDSFLAETPKVFEVEKRTMNKVEGIFYPRKIDRADIEAYYKHHFRESNGHAKLCYGFALKYFSDMLNKKEWWQTNTELKKAGWGGCLDNYAPAHVIHVESFPGSIPSQDQKLASPAYGVKYFWAKDKDENNLEDLFSKALSKNESTPIKPLVPEVLIAPLASTKDTKKEEWKKVNSVLTGMLQKWIRTAFRDVDLLEDTNAGITENKKQIEKMLLERLDDFSKSDEFKKLFASTDQLLEAKKRLKNSIALVYAKFLSPRNLSAYVQLERFLQNRQSEVNEELRKALKSPDHKVQEWLHALDGVNFTVNFLRDDGWKAKGGKEIANQSELGLKLIDSNQLKFLAIDYPEMLKTAAPEQAGLYRLYDPDGQDLSYVMRTLAEEYETMRKAEIKSTPIKPDSKQQITLDAVKKRISELYPQSSVLK